jgi:hypothetical protein
LPALRHVRQQCVRLGLPGSDRPALLSFADRAVAMLNGSAQRERVLVALVDGELCAYAALWPQRRQFRWEVRVLAAGSPRLDATEHVCVELWTALLESAVQHAGESGAKRLVAVTDDDGPAYASLSASGFDAYTAYTVLTGSLPASPMPIPNGLRRQEPSDVWSVHQLYHRLTPRAVQFAEAVTSAEWEVEERHNRFRNLRRAMPHLHDECSFVIETEKGIDGHCRITHSGGVPFVSVMIDHEAREQAVALVLSAVKMSGMDGRGMLRVAVPEYASELVGMFENEGFNIECHLHALVRHTTVPVIVRDALQPLSALELHERVPRGVPTYLMGRPAAAENGSDNTRSELVRH